ncbi:MAG TPA: SPFH domain-containing protein, partial [Myxococcaceae bacterium]|nr:SPFH domain-containing protein [Myxococcaceae bacterium]
MPINVQQVRAAIEQAQENALVQQGQGTMTSRQFARPAVEHVSLGRGLRVVILLILWAGGSLLSGLLGLGAGGLPGAGVTFPLGIIVSFFIALYLSHVVRVAAQWERGVVLRLGKYHGLKGPGVILVFPVMDTVRFVDTRLLTLDIPHQQVITRDNVPVRVDGVIFFQVRDPERAVITVQDYRFAVSQYAQASLRDVIGSMTLDELLSERDKIQSKIAAVVESRASMWGTHIDSIRLLDIDMP